MKVGGRGKEREGGRKDVFLCSVCVHVLRVTTR